MFCTTHYRGAWSIITTTPTSETCLIPMWGIALAVVCVIALIAWAGAD